MLAAIDQQPNLLKSRLGLASLVGIFLDPVVMVLSLAGVTALYGEAFEAHYVILSLIVFSLTFPGRSQLHASVGDMYRDVVGSWLLVGAILMFFGYASGYLRVFPQEIVTAWLVATPAALLASHHAARLLLPRVLALQANLSNVVIVGANDVGLQLARRIVSDPMLGMRLIGFFDDRRRERLGNVDDFSLIGPLRNLAEYCHHNQVDTIYMALPMATQPRILHLLDDLKDTTASIYFVPDLFITDLIQARMDNVGGVPVVAVCDSPFTGTNGITKRLSDIVLSLLILLLISPVMAAIAAGVKLSSPGPVFFRQRRYGLDGKEIMVYKFRSMTVCEDGDEIRQAQKGDQRITPFGAFLRKTSLDELPQFINVLQGRMSIVGPRPHAVAHNEMYRKLIKGYMVRHKVKPGITGWAQVNGLRGETETLEKMQARIEYDLEYLRNWSLKLDLKIILRTVGLVLKDANAY